MKIERLVLQNIGVYRNRNEFDLRADRPIILIGGMNGRGKTTLLESVLLALYGRRLPELIQSPLKFDDYLRKISNITGDTDQCFAEITFSIEEQDTVEYCVRRSWDCQKKNLRMATKVRKNGREDEALSGNWDMFVEEILPHAIAPFFFFNGEKIAELAASQSDEHLRSSIMSLLGIDRIEQLIRDLEEVMARKRREFAHDQNEQELEQIEDQIRECRKEYGDRQKEIDKRQALLADLEKKRQELEGRYNAAGGEYVKQKGLIEEKRKQLLEEKSVLRQQLLEISAADLPLRMVSYLLREIRKGADAEKGQKSLQVFLEEYPRLYKEYSKQESLDRDALRFMEHVRDKIKDQTAVYDLDEETREHLDEMDQLISGEAAAAREILKKQSEIDERLEEIGNYLEIRTDDEELAKLSDEIQACGKEIMEADAERRILKESADRLAEQEKSLQRNRKQILNKVLDKLDMADENARIIAYAGKQISIMNRYRELLQMQKTSELSRQMTECFKRLSAKDGLIEDIQIDPITLDFSYRNREGRQIDRMRLSSGEQQLLVISMLWALGICSRVEFPVIIDTPLARLDSAHRETLIRNYFTQASKQVIILSTDQEIRPEDYGMLREEIGREFTLVYDEDTMSSTVREGYFGGKDV